MGLAPRTPARLTVACLALLATGRAAAAPRPPSSLLTGQARVRQGSTEFTIRPLQEPRSTVAFYSYNVPSASCANTGLETVLTSLLLLHEDTSVVPPALSLVLIHDRPLNTSGGNATMAFTGLPASTVISVRDDGPDTFVPDPPAGGQTTATWDWGPCCTDGAAFDGLETGPFCIGVQPLVTSGIAWWKALDGPDPAFPGRYDLPSLRTTTYLCGDCQVLDCPSSVIAECGGAGSAHVDLVASGRSLCGGDAITNDRTAGGADASGDYAPGSTFVTFTLSDAPGFVSTCTTEVIVRDDSTPPIVRCPPQLDIDCAGLAGVPVTDPRVQAWLAQFTASDACGAVTLSNDAPALFPATCGATLTTVTFTATDAMGNADSCAAPVVIRGGCQSPPPNVGAGLRIGMHGDPLATDITCVMDWTRDEGLPRAGEQHYHVLRGVTPQALGPVPGIEPFTGLTLAESTPAATSLPLVHFYSVLAADSCDNVSLD